MRRKRNSAWTAVAAVAAVAFASLAFAGPASAKLVGEFTKFQYCPRTNVEVKRCLYSVTNSGEVVMGNKKVPIEKKVIIQGGFGKPNAETKKAKFYAATNGETLQKVPQNVPGGLAGIVPDASSPWLVKRLIKFFFENSLTGLDSTLELAGSASAIEISEFNLSHKEGTALYLPVKVRLENPFLGSKCYVGSDSSPMKWNLTSGTTSPPEPNKPITGSFGESTFLEEGFILHLDNNKLVDNAWSAPKATGCGGLIAFLVTPIVNSQLGTTTAGHNTAILNNTVDLTSVAALKLIDEKNP